MNLEEMYNATKPVANEPVLNEPVLCTPEIFFEKYKNGDIVVQTLIEDLQRIISDIDWFKETNRENEAICIDFLDALNNLSISI